MPATAPTSRNPQAPVDGEPITMKEGRLQRARQAGHPLHRGRRHRPRHLARPRTTSSTPPWSGRTAASRRIAWLEVLAGEKAKDRLNSWLPDETLAAIDRTPGGHQGAADDAGRRRLPLAQRGAPPEARPLRLRAAGALVRGGALAGQGAAGREHGDLPREHGGHLRRHRVQGEDRRSTAGHRVPPGADGRADHPLSGQQRHRHQAGVRGGLQAADPRRDRICHRPEAAERDAGPQGQHHEVHRGRLP